MNNPLPADLFMMKGAEYLLVIGFLVALALFWRLLGQRRALTPTPMPAGPAAMTPSGWFSLPLERLYHPGHAWARPDSDGLVTLGLDDFAQKIVGQPDVIGLPELGSSVEQGQPLSHLAVGGKAVDLLAPLDGEVVELNQAVLDRPELLNQDPYGTGWLLRVRPSRWEANSENLFKGSAARTWMSSMEDSLRQRMSPSFGLLLQDGGVPVSGIARVLAGDDWDELAKDYLLS